MADAAAGASTLAPRPSSTLYVQNLNESIKLPVLKQSLEALFSTYGPVLSIVAHSNLRMRGQAFISFGDTETATRALEEVNGFPLYGKGMRIAYAKTPSDSVVAATNPDGLSAHQEARKERKRIWRRNNPQRLRAMLRHINAEKAARGEAALLPAKSAASQARAQANQVPDEYLPPNKLLFIQGLPTSVGKAELEALFGAYPGLEIVRTIPAKTDIAFIEYADIPQAVAAREALNNYVLSDGSQMRVSFARA
ncbi:hypothetical protein MCUN1_003198 [Malassezia cuniculi]|uniref:RRM domain-containing protein n=1 Tax=Malassezia cuniculi TaxID=948313 RepID=A0AAF0EXI4_9BASI|nr:hypothetical protein MCUN1_003198 [Malassezia cuniculi]